MKECHVRKGVFDFERDLRGCEMIEFLAGKSFWCCLGGVKRRRVVCPTNPLAEKGSWMLKRRNADCDYCACSLSIASIAWHRLYRGYQASAN